MKRIFLAIGTNIGDRSLNLKLAKNAINAQIGVVNKESSIYQTAAWGLEEQDDFYNQVIEVCFGENEDIIPLDILKKCKRIEDEMGRVKFQKWGPRLIDIDILFCANEVVDLAELRVPHPHLQDRNFVLVPLCEIAPDLVHPVMQKSMKKLLEDCVDELPVKVVSDVK